MHATNKVCIWRSLATEFPCSHEDSNQSWNPKAASALVFVTAQASLGECFSLVLLYLCTADLGWSPSKCKFTSTTLSSQAPSQHLWILQPAGTCLRVLLMCPAACITSVIFFLPHQTFPFFWLSHFLLLSNLLKFSISLSPLRSSPYPDPAYTCLLSYRERQHRTKGPLNCEISCQN